MPAVRFSRDKRGYEYVYLVHTPMKRGKAGRSRVLYWYRTPPGVRIGRKPFDEDVQRTLERQNPGVSFDWEAIIGTPMPPPDMTEFWRERRKAERAAKQERRAEEAADPPDTTTPEPINAGRPESTAPDLPEVEPLAVTVVQTVESTEPSATPGEGRADETAVRKKRRRRGGRRRKGPGGEPLPQASLGGEAASASDDDSTDEGPDDPADEADSTSEGE